MRKEVFSHSFENIKVFDTFRHSQCQIHCPLRVEMQILHCKTWGFDIEYDANGFSLSSRWEFNSFGAKFQTTFVVCFFILTNCRLERRLYVKLKDWMSNSVDQDETAQWAVSSGSMLFAKPIFIACGSERVKRLALWVNFSADDILKYIFPENKIWHFIQYVSNVDNLLEILYPVFLEKKSLLCLLLN